MTTKLTQLSPLAATVALAVGLGLSFGASAQSTLTGSSPSASPADYTTLDADKDGSVSKKEASKNKELSKKFSSLDANKDGKLDTGEFAQFEGAPSSASPGSSSPYDTQQPAPKP